MTPEETARVLDDIDEYGLHSLFLDRKAYPEIKDKTFHQLREQFIRSVNALMHYLGE